MNNKSELNLIIFCSRNKDNREKMNDSWKERDLPFVSTKSYEELKTKFKQFVSDGQPGETCRWYQSINPRDNQRVIADLQHYLLDHPDCSAAKIPSKLASLAGNTKNSAGKRWLFDYDDKPERLETFLADVSREGQFNRDEITVIDTLSGHAVITPHGFDVRSLMAEWPLVELKRDALLLVEWAVTFDH